MSGMVYLCCKPWSSAEGASGGRDVVVQSGGKSVPAVDTNQYSGICEMNDTTFGEVEQ